jgi:hypothetical protein
MADFIQPSRKQRLGGVASSCYGVRAISEGIDTGAIQLFPRAWFGAREEPFSPCIILKAQ